MLNTIAGGSTGSRFQISWNYEYICFTVDNNGIASVHWMSPIAVGDVVQENAVLKSFPEIMGVFEKMVRVQYEPMLNTRYPDGNIEINVDDIELCLMRVREPNGDGTTGLLVPAWVFRTDTTLQRIAPESSRLIFRAVSPTDGRRRR